MLTTISVLQTAVL